MAAVLAPTSIDPAVRPGRSAAPRPALRVIHGGRSARRRATARVYLRRRLLVALGLVLVATTLAFAFVGARSLVAADAPVGDTAPASAATAAVPPAAAEAYVVRPGDTLWTIAAQLPAGGDVRALVDELADRAGGSVLQAGQRIDLTGLGG